MQKSAKSLLKVARGKFGTKVPKSKNGISSREKVAVHGISLCTTWRLWTSTSCMSVSIQVLRNQSIEISRIVLSIRVSEKAANPHGCVMVGESAFPLPRPKQPPNSVNDVSDEANVSIRDKQHKLVPSALAPAPSRCKLSLLVQAVLGRIAARVSSSG